MTTPLLVITQAEETERKVDRTSGLVGDVVGPHELVDHGLDDERVLDEHPARSTTGEPFHDGHVVLVDGQHFSRPTVDRVTKLVEVHGRVLPVNPAEVSCDGEDLTHDELVVLDVLEFM